ncbi:MAG: von Willebrand factor type A domain-containing protein [Vicinamibacteria bacterium]|nr:von Willebrand factor type A domain-containing protein [Vicinamibacteria bacterium]
MKCVREDLKAHITDVLVGEAGTAVKEEVLLHLESCASCREDRDRTALVLGLLKEAPPWVESSADADTLSAVQRQKVESLAGRRAPAARAAKPASLPMSWLAMAASLAAVGIALVLARRGVETPIEVPAPAATASSVHELPQAPEGPMLPRPSVLATPESVTTPAAERSRTPTQVPVAPEAMREFRRQVEAEQGRVLPQAAESNEAPPAKKDRQDSAPGLQGTAAGAASIGDLGGRPADLAPAPAAPPASAEARKQEMEALRKSLAQPGLANPRASADEMRSELRESDARQAKAQRLRELEQQDARASASAEPSRRNQPVQAPPPRDMFFESKGTNPFIVTEEDPQATFGLDVDTASYMLTRNYLNRGLLPPASAVRVEEFVNAFPNNLLADRGGDSESAFAVRVDGAPNPLHPGYHILRVAMKAKEVDPRERKAAHLTFVIDVSGSMAAENRLGLVKRSLGLLIDKLDERDTIGIVVYGTNGRRVLPPTSADNRERIMSAIERLRPEGSTNLEDGLELGYEMAMESFRRGASNRVVLCTDGVANTGETEADALLARIRSEAKRGIDLMALGFGMGNYNDALLQRLADEGNGQYAYIDDLGEARAFFLRRLTSVLEVVARDAKAQVEFNPARVERYRLLGYEKRDVADRDFRNDAVDAGEINSGHSVTALFEVKLVAGPGRGRIGVARIRYKTGPRSEGTEFSREIADEAVARSFEAASPAFRTAYVAARFAEHLRKSYWVKDESLAALQPLADELPESPPANELADLIRRAARLVRPVVREDW